MVDKKNTEKLEEEAAEAKRLEQERLDALAKKFGVEKVFEIEAFNDKGEKVTGLFKRPDRSVYGAAASVENRNPISAKEIVLRACFLDGDKRILDNDEFFYSACTAVEDILSVRSASVKKN